MRPDVTMVPVVLGEKTPRRRWKIGLRGLELRPAFVSLNPTKKRFWNHVKKGDGCWLWTGAGSGYGTFSFRPGVLVGAHRAAWLLTRGQIPDGMDIAHKCDVRKCVRPSHLFLATRLENMQDAKRKGRTRRKK